jgi:hypothetical protein
MTIERILPIAMIVQCLIASIVYFVKGDIRHGFYWLFAGAITVTQL